MSCVGNHVIHLVFGFGCGCSTEEAEEEAEEGAVAGAEEGAVLSADMGGMHSRSLANVCAMDVAGADPGSSSMSNVAELSSFWLSVPSASSTSSSFGASVAARSLAAWGRTSCI